MKTHKEHFENKYTQRQFRFYYCFEMLLSLIAICFLFVFFLSSFLISPENDVQRTEAISARIFCPVAASAYIIFFGTLIFEFAFRKNHLLFANLWLFLPTKWWKNLILLVLPQPFWFFLIPSLIKNPSMYNNSIGFNFAPFTHSIITSYFCLLIAVIIPLLSGFLSSKNIDPIPRPLSFRKRLAFRVLSIFSTLILTVFGFIVTIINPFLCNIVALIFLFGLLFWETLTLVLKRDFEMVFGFALLRPRFYSWLPLLVCFFFFGMACYGMVSIFFNFPILIFSSVTVLCFLVFDIVMVFGLFPVVVA